MMYALRVCRGDFPTVGNRPWSALIFLLLRADKKVGGEPQNRGGNYLKRIINLVWPKPGIAELAEARGDQLSFAPHYRQFQP